MSMKKQNLVLIITTFDSDALRISVPPLARVARHTTLVIYNDNPGTCVTRHMIRHMGWRGGLQIVNSDKNSGEFGARIAAIRYLMTKKFHADWIMVADDDDIVLDTDVPAAPENVFAVVRNATTISDNLTDIFKVRQSWTDGTEYGKTGPHFAITGTAIRARYLYEFADFIEHIMPEIEDTIRHTRYRLPIAEMMWNCLNAFMRVLHPTATPIYMNKTNYVAVKMGHAHEKYGHSVPIAPTTRGTATRVAKKIVQFVDAAAQNMVAESQ